MFDILSAKALLGGIAVLLLAWMAWVSDNLMAHQSQINDNRTVSAVTAVKVANIETMTTEIRSDVKALMAAPPRKGK